MTGLTGKIQGLSEAAYEVFMAAGQDAPALPIDEIGTALESFTGVVEAAHLLLHAFNERVRAEMEKPERHRCVRLDTALLNLDSSCNTLEAAHVLLSNGRAELLHLTRQGVVP